MTQTAPSLPEAPAQRRKPRRLNGEGSLYQLEKTGLWRASIVATREVEQVQADGTVLKVKETKKIIGSSMSKTEAVARRAVLLERFMNPEAYQQAMLVKGQPGRRIPRTFGELLDEWLAWKTNTHDDKHKVSPAVARMYERAINLHIKPALGTLELKSITRRHLARFLDTDLAAKTKPDGSPLLGSSPKRTIRNVITMSFGYAIREEILALNPAVELPTFRKARMNPEGLDNDSDIIWRLLSGIKGTDEEAYWILALTTGCRRAERLGLEWSCLKNFGDPDHGYHNGEPVLLEIKQQLVRNVDTGRMELKRQTKTAAGRRLIPLDERVVRVLWEHKLRQDAQKRDPRWKPLPGLENLIYTLTDPRYPLGLPITHGRDNKRFHSLFDRVINGRDTGVPELMSNVPHIRQHGLRHLVITRLISMGVPLEYVMRISGSADESIIRGTYSHLSWRSAVEPMKELTASLYNDANSGMHPWAQKPRRQD